MNISLCLLILISTSVPGDSVVSPENPLVGKCAEYEYPWKVLIKDEESGDTCEGSIINFNHILIQASCVTNKVDIAQQFEDHLRLSRLSHF